MVVSEIVENIRNYVTNLNYIPLDIVVVNKKDHYDISFAIFKKGGVTVGDCEKVTLFTRDFLIAMIGEDFSLSVSSPGAERVLKELDEFDIFYDNKAKITLKDGKTHTGILKGTENEKSNLLFENSENNELERIKISDIAKCRLVL